MKRYLIHILIALAIVCVMGTMCMAAPVSYVLDDNSTLHVATPPATTLGGIDWYTSGPTFGILDGTLTGDLSGGLLTLDPGTLQLDSPGWELQILGGQLTEGLAGGSIDYALSNGHHVFESGTFYFGPYDFGGPNFVSGERIDLWGQNFLGRGPEWLCGKQDFLPLGLDISGTAPTPTPEPATMAMLGLGLGAAGLARRRRSTAGR